MRCLPPVPKKAGTPEGVGPMNAGDEVEISIQGIGNLTNKVVKRD